MSPFYKQGLFFLKCLLRSHSSKLQSRWRNFDGPVGRRKARVGGRAAGEEAGAALEVVFEEMVNEFSGVWKTLAHQPGDASEPLPPARGRPAPEGSRQVEQSQRREDTDRCRGKRKNPFSGQCSCRRDSSLPGRSSDSQRGTAASASRKETAPTWLCVLQNALQEGGRNRHFHSNETKEKLSPADPTPGGVYWGCSRGQNRAVEGVGQKGDWAQTGVRPGPEREDVSGV